MCESESAVKVASVKAIDCEKRCGNESGCSDLYSSNIKSYYKYKVNKTI